MFAFTGPWDWTFVQAMTPVQLSCPERTSSKRPGLQTLFRPPTSDRLPHSTSSACSNSSVPSPVFSSRVQTSRTFRSVPEVTRTTPAVTVCPAPSNMPPARRRSFPCGNAPAAPRRSVPLSTATSPEKAFSAARTTVPVDARTVTPPVVAFGASVAATV